MILVHDAATLRGPRAADLAMHMAPDHRKLRWAAVGLNAMPPHIERDIGAERAAALRLCGRDLFLRFMPGAPEFDTARFAEAAAVAGKWWPWPGNAGSATREPFGLDVPALWGVLHAQMNTLWRLCGETGLRRMTLLWGAERAARNLVDIQGNLIGPPYDWRPTRIVTPRKIEAAWERFEYALARAGGGLVLLPVLTLHASPVPPRAVGRPEFSVVAGGAATVPHTGPATDGPDAAA